MSTRSSEVTAHTAFQATPADEANNEVFPHEQHQGLESGRGKRVYLPEQEIRRRLWRLYDMAFAAANRTEAAGQEQSVSSCDERSCNS